MFEGNKDCSICRKTVGEKEKNFGLSLTGYTYVFCDSCFKSRKDQIKKLLHDEA